MMQKEQIRLSQPWLAEFLPFLATRVRTVKWVAYRDDKLVAKGRAFNFTEGEKKANEALKAEKVT